MNDTNEKCSIWTISLLYPPNFTGAGLQAHKEHWQMVRLGKTVNVLTRGIAMARQHRGKVIDLDGVQVRYLPVVSLPDLSTTSRFFLLDKLKNSILHNLSSLSFAIMVSWILWLNGKRGDIVRFEAYNRYAIIPLFVTRLKRLHSIARVSLLGSDDPYAVLQRARAGQVLEYLTFYFYKRVDVIVAICSAVIESCHKSKIDMRKIVYIPYGVDTDLYMPVNELEKQKLRQNLGLDPNKRYVIFVGAAVYRKGIDVIVDAFIQARFQLPDLELLIVGPDKFDNLGVSDAYGKKIVVESLKNKLIEAECADFVHWLGSIDNVNEFMKAADIFCLPTRNEGFGIVIIEAMASGLPVVVSRLAGITTDIISSEDEGVIIDGHCSEDYASVILELFNHLPKLRLLALSSRRRSVSTFGMESAIKGWMKLFNDLGNSTRTKHSSGFENVG